MGIQDLKRQKYRVVSFSPGIGGTAEDVSGTIFKFELEKIALEPGQIISGACLNYPHITDVMLDERVQFDSKGPCPTESGPTIPIDARPDNGSGGYAELIHGSTDPRDVTKYVARASAILPAAKAWTPAEIAEEILRAYRAIK
jgi:hypothetical protein